MSGFVYDKNQCNLVTLFYIVLVPNAFVFFIRLKLYSFDNFTHFPLFHIFVPGVSMAPKASE